jgi:hypothetical protein
MAIRRVLHELEARLEPTPQSASGGASKGKLEFKRYGDGRQRMKISCKKLDLPDGAELQLRCGDTTVAILEARQGRAEIDEERGGSEDTPALSAGVVVTLCHQGTPLLSGQLYLD